MLGTEVIVMNETKTLIGFQAEDIDFEGEKKLFEIQIMKSLKKIQ